MSQKKPDYQNGSKNKTQLYQDSEALLKNRQLYQWNRIERPVINPYNYSQLIFDKGKKIIHWSKNTVFQQIVGQLDIHMHKMNVDLEL